MKHQKILVAVLALLIIPVAAGLIVYAKSGLDSAVLNILLPTLLHIDICALLLILIFGKEQPDSGSKNNRIP